MPNACFSNPRHPNLDPKTNRKSNLEIDMKRSSFLVQKCPKSSQNGSPKSSKNRQNPSLGLTESFLVPSNVPGSSQDRPSTAPGSPQDRPRVPQDAKGEAPSMPNDTYGYQNPPKINKNQGLDLKVLFCCLLCSPMSQNWPRVPQHAKVKQPIMPNNRFAYQRCQDALATMPRISIPEEMGNGRGPAAEGVAHKN